MTRRLFGPTVTMGALAWVSWNLVDRGLYALSALLLLAIVWPAAVIVARIEENERSKGSPE